MSGSVLYMLLKAEKLSLDVHSPLKNIIECLFTFSLRWHTDITLTAHQETRYTGCTTSPDLWIHFPCTYGRSRRSGIFPCFNTRQCRKYAYLSICRDFHRWPCWADCCKMTKCRPCLSEIMDVSGISWRCHCLSRIPSEYYKDEAIYGIISWWFYEARRLVAWQLPNKT